MSAHWSFWHTPNPDFVTTTPERNLTMNESKLLAKIQATHPDIVNQVISEAEAELTAAQSQLESAQSGFQGAQSALTEAQTRFATAQADHADLTGTTYATTAQPLIVPINE